MANWQADVSNLNRQATLTLWVDLQSMIFLFLTLFKTIFKFDIVCFLFSNLTLLVAPIAVARQNHSIAPCMVVW
jgi:hypothetical protein